MIYDLNEAREQIIDAGRALVENRLAARTWGNISARISENEFLITPSGRAYDSLKPGDLVKVRISDLACEEGKKPSSEKGIHALIYKAHSKAGFVLHTHQCYASAISVTGEDQSFAPCAAYGLPGTGDLMLAVLDAVKANPRSKVFLMKNHGALCYGDNYEEALENALELEQSSKSLYLRILNYTPKSDDEVFRRAMAVSPVIHAYLDDFAQVFGYSVKGSFNRRDLCRGEESEVKEAILMKNCAATLVAAKCGAKPLSPGDAALQYTVYKTKYSKLKDK